MGTRKNLHPLTQSILDEYANAADPERAGPMKKYMRDQFGFFGISSPNRKLISSGYFRNFKITDSDELKRIVQELWSKPQRECQYFAMELLAKKVQLLGEKDAEFIEQLVINKSWWDTVDFISSNVAGPWLKKHPGLIRNVTGRWNRSDNLWLQRMSLLFQLKYKNMTDTGLMEKYIRNLSSSKEFFIRKAIGWLLREYSKTNPGWVEDFVEREPLSPLSKKEALKVISVRP